MLLNTTYLFLLLDHNNIDIAKEIKIANGKMEEVNNALLYLKDL